MQPADVTQKEQEHLTAGLGDWISILVFWRRSGRAVFFKKNS
jgi:hypothetical protein